MSANSLAFSFQTTDMSKTQAKTVWNGLKRGIEEIQNGNASTLRFEELYRNAYTLVLHKHGDILYEGVEEVIISKLLKTAEQVANTTDNQLLEIIVEKWQNHTLTMTMIRDILMYMDKTYCENKHKMLAYNLGIVRFKDIVLMNPRILGRIRAQILNTIECDRNNEKIDELLIRNCLRMFVDVDLPNNNSELYDVEFEKYFLEATRNYYRNESEIYIAENTVYDYLLKVEERLNQEEHRGESYIPKKHTRDHLLKTCEHELIERYVRSLIENEQSGCKDMFVKNRIDDLKRMYHLFGRVDDTNSALQQAMYDYVKNEGERIISNEENIKNPEKFVEEVLALRQQFQNIVTNAFEEDKIFQRKLKEAFEHFINLDIRAAQYLSLYTDALLRHHAAKLSDDEVFKNLDNVIIIFKYLSDKDIFEDFYKQHLASRLLHAKSHSDHYEKAMIAKLKTECGHQYTSKLEGMFKDIHQSRQINEQYQQFLQHLGENDNNNTRSVQLDCKVLTTGFWPFPRRNACKLPEEVVMECEKFRQYYCEKHSGRRLQFDTYQGQAELSVEFASGRKELVCSTYQMCVLMLFNDHEILTYQEIKQKTGIESEDLERHILALAHPKVNILKKKPNRKQLEDSDQFAFNNKYKNARVRVIINILAPNVTNKDKIDENNPNNLLHTNANNTNIPSNILETRKNGVEAAIVRIMKARKTLTHNNLIAEVVKQLSTRFNPDPTFIKQRIASLIEREYMERDENDRKVYHYLA